MMVELCRNTHLQQCRTPTFSSPQYSEFGNKDRLTPRDTRSQFPARRKCSAHARHATACVRAFPSPSFINSETMSNADASSGYGLRRLLWPWPWPLPKGWKVFSFLAAAQTKTRAIHPRQALAAGGPCHSPVSDTRCSFEAGFTL